MARNTHFNRRLHVEPLERRELLCSGTAGTASVQAGSQLAAFARSHAAVAAVASSSHTESGSEDESAETHLFATLTNSSGTVVGTAAFESETDGTNTNQKLVITVLGAAANATYEVTTGTTDLGAITTDANGNGRLVLASSTATSTASTASAKTTTTGTLPADFTLAAGATIMLASTDTTVDPLNGTFATASGDIGLGNGHGRGGCHGDNGDNNVTRVEASLTNGTTSVGRAVFSTYTNSDGTTTDLLRVHLKGADTSTTLDVSIDGTSLGSISTDAKGNGILILSSNPKSSNVGQLPTGFTVTSTSTIQIGTTITGSFGSSTTSSSVRTMAFSGVSSTRSFSFRRR